MKKKLSFLIALLAIVSLQPMCAQEFNPIWAKGKMPNSKGLQLTDSIANERVYQVATPGVYVFHPSIAENKKAAVLIIPGGGYARLAYQISGFQLAKWFNTMGITAFVLNHRLPQSPDVIESYKAPVQDGQRALKFIRAHAPEWGIDKDKVGVMGSSAGGHLSVCLSTFDTDWSNVGDSIDKQPYTPDFTVLISPVVTMDERFVHKGSRENLLGKNPTKELLHDFSCENRVSAHTPPAFLIHASNDPAVSPMNSVLYYTALFNSGVKKSTLHVFPEGGHSIALRNNPGTTNTWISLVEQWLGEIEIIK